MSTPSKNVPRKHGAVGASDGLFGELLLAVAKAICALKQSNLQRKRKTWPCSVSQNANIHIQAVPRR